MEQQTAHEMCTAPECHSAWPQRIQQYLNFIRAANMTITRASCLALCLGSVLCLAACGGNGLASIGGSVAGLGAGLSLTLQNNGSDSVTLTNNQSFSFATKLASGATYNVAVVTQPIGQTCSVASGAGVVDSVADDVTNISVSCATTSSVGGNLSGLAAGTSVTLITNGLALTLAANGIFAFPGTIAAGSVYNVAVSVQPVGETCTVSGGSGTVLANVMASVAVTCN
jgi:hypothetical protein